MGSKSLWDAARFNLALYQGDATVPSCDLTNLLAIYKNGKTRRKGSRGHKVDEFLRP
jgi:hypothetical protein